IRSALSEKNAGSRPGKSPLALSPSVCSYRKARKISEAGSTAGRLCKVRIWDIDRDFLLRIPLSYVPRAAQKVSKAEWRTGGKALTKDALLLRYRVLSSRIAAFFSQNDKLHHARFANPHELTSLLSPTVDGTHL